MRARAGQNLEYAGEFLHAEKGITNTVCGCACARKRRVNSVTQTRRQHVQPGAAAVLGFGFFKVLRSAVCSSSFRSSLLRRSWLI